MDVDLNLAVGAGLLCLAIPSLISAMLDRRFPLVALIVAGFGLFLIGWVVVGLHGGWPRDLTSAWVLVFETLPQVVMAIPHAFIEVAGRVIGYFF
ncbi:hypothetical protein [Pseudooceanicola sp.]|uniref:hypothetical protein n=1 Tax=Pseudooceanicola sp. TaxID=1914328 RepID=UPI00261163DE|nr:hypothetical protein [Pseudooceanicola sp.]MDF1856525.1 hypothetical protein [Pseudooceanicola sp.]